MIKRIIQKKSYHKNNWVGIDENKYSQKALDRYDQIKKYDTLKKQKCSEAVIMEVIGVPRSTLFRWRRQYSELGLMGLEDEFKRPHTVRKTTWTAEIEKKVYHLRKKYPLYGKAKLAVLYKEEYKEIISISTLGRIIVKLIKLGKIDPVAVLCQRKISKKRVFNSHAKRWKYGMRSNEPGELVQIDHMTVQVAGHDDVKQFNATCPTTKYAVEKIYKTACSKNAANFLKRVIEQLPFPIKSIQVDGGSEFMAEFENLCQKLGIALYVLPPRSPRYNGNVERSNGTFKYEFYSQLPDRVRSFHLIQRDLDKFVLFYNTKRPHQSLGYLTPCQFFSSLKDGTQKSHMS